MTTKIRAFTLIELLIVVAIIAILAAIAVPNFLEAQVRSKVSRARADLRSVATAFEAYAVDNNTYPPMCDRSSIASWSLFQDIGDGGDDHARTPSYITTPISYISSLPYDPFIPVSSLAASPDYVREIGKRHAYFNFDQFVDNFGGFTSQLDHAGSWLMYSYGPDKDPFNKLGDPSNLTVYINYDPTNGTVSRGNIFRTHKYTDRYGNENAP